MSATVYHRLIFGGRRGVEPSNRITATQNSIRTDYVFLCYYEDGTEYIFQTGDTAAGAFTDRETGLEYSITGTVTPSIGQNALTWARDLADVALPSAFDLAFTITSATAEPDKSFNALYIVYETTGGGGSPSTPTLVELLKDWATDPLNYATSLTYDGTYTWRVNSAVLQWPDGSAGAYTATAFSVNVNALGFTDAYTATHTVSGLTATAAAVTRNTIGNITVKPAIVVA